MNTKLAPAVLVLVAILTLLATLWRSSAELSLVPVRTTNDTLELTVVGAVSTNAYVINYTPVLTTNGGDFYPISTGAVGQAVFEFLFTTNVSGFFTVEAAPNTPPQVAAPVFSPAGGMFAGPTNVIVTCATAGAAIYYTTNGATPTPSDFFVANGGGVALPCSLTLKARAFRTGFVDSAVTTETYLVNCAPMVFAGTQQVIFASSTTLQGMVSDDGLPSGITVTSTWSKVSGPGTVSFANVNLTNSGVTLGSAGIYVLELAATDSQLAATGRVTVAWNPTVSVALISPTNGFTATVPTNLVLRATASCDSGSVTQVVFYSGGTWIGTAEAEPYDLDWRSVPAGTHALTAVALTDDPANAALASDPVTITVNWPTNVGQLNFTATDLQLPAPGFPLAVTRVHDTRLGTNGSFGFNARLEHEAARISIPEGLDEGWFGVDSGFTYCIEDTEQRLITVTLREGETYYFVPRLIFVDGEEPCVASFVQPTIYNDYQVRFVCLPVGLGQLTVAEPQQPVGMDGGSPGAWEEPLTVTYYDDFLFPDGPYSPQAGEFTFTAPDGTQYQFNNNGTLLRRIDRNGNRITYGSTAITYNHPDVSGSTRTIGLARDGGGRITNVFDALSPAPGGPAALRYAYDSNGNLTNVARLIQRSPTVYEGTAYRYTNTAFPNHLTHVVDARGVTVQHNVYDANGRLTQQFDAHTNATTWTYDFNARRHTVTDRNFRTTVQNFTPSGQLASTLDGEGAVTTFGYDERGRRTAETNAVLEVTTFGYDDNDNLTGATNGLQLSTTATYNEFGLPLVTVDARGFGTTNGYDAKGNLVAVTNALGVVTRYGYDAQGNRIRETNAFGAAPQTVVTNRYDAFGLLTNTVNALGHTNTFTYDANGNRLAERRWRTTGGGATLLATTNTYDAANRVLTAREPDGFTNHFAYNAIGRLDTQVDKLGRTNRFLYDLRGLPATNVFADGLTEIFAHDPEERRTNSVDRAGRATRFEHDAAGRLTRTTFPDGSWTESQYDAAGRVRATLQGPRPSGIPFSVEPPPRTTRFGYDAAGRRVAITNAWITDVQSVTLSAYDANGNETLTTNALGHATTNVFDALNRRIEVRHPDGTKTVTLYDELDRRVGEVDAAGVTNRFGYDALGRLTSVTNAWGTTDATVTRYTYDEPGNLLTHVDALNRTNRYEYDNLGRRTRAFLPGGQAEGFGYDAAGNLRFHTNHNGVAVTNTYDSLDRLHTRADSNGVFAAFTYTATGRRATASNHVGLVTYAYDERDRLKTNASPQGVLLYTHDAFGNLQSLQSTATNGVRLGYDYDALNRLETVTNTVAGSNWITRYAFDAAGNLRTNIPGNGLTNAYAFDSLNRLTNLAATGPGGTVASFAYRLGPAGHRTNLVETVNGAGRTYAWQLNALYRLTGETITGATPTGTVTYGYDAVGNRTNRSSSISGLPSASHSYGTNDTLSTDVYDLAGNTRTNGANVFLYDREHRLTNATVNGTNVVIAYDADGNRVRKTVGSLTTLYLVDDRNPTGFAQVLEERTVTGGVTNMARVFAYGLDLISQHDVAGGTTLYFGHDGLGSTRHLTTTNGTIANVFAYDAFGTLIASNAAPQTDHLFAGEQRDPHLGLDYLRSRYLNTGTGRFWTRDSFEGHWNDPPSLHKYTYAHNNPVNGTDPSGNEFTSTGTLTVGGGFSTFGTFSSAATLAAQARIIAKIGVTAIAIGATLSGDRPDLNQMRVQLQAGTDNYWSQPLFAPSTIGVTALQVRESMLALNTAAGADATDITVPDRYLAQLYSAVVQLSARLRAIVAGGGVTQGGNVLREQFGDGQLRFRLDLENLRGHNLRQ